jgi:hypothetical protein
MRSRNAGWAALAASAWTGCSSQANGTCVWSSARIPITTTCIALHRTLNQAAPLRPLPDAVTDLDHFRIRRRDRAGGVIHEYRLVA